MPEFRAGLSGLRGLIGRALGLALLDEGRCPSCGRVLPPGSRACPDCACFDEPATAEAAEPCPGCGEYPPDGRAFPLLCGTCRTQPRPWGRVLTAGRYAGGLKELILAYKFESRLDCGRRLQEHALAAFTRGLANFPELAEVSALVPVPLHPRRLLSRGFNQSREIVRLLSARHKLPIRQEWLARVRRTRPQMELSRLERAANIEGAFSAAGQGLAGATVLLCDDIMTTGATLEECARALTAAGARAVHVLVLARA